MSEIGPGMRGRSRSKNDSRVRGGELRISSYVAWATLPDFFCDWIDDGCVGEIPCLKKRMESDRRDWAFQDVLLFMLREAYVGLKGICIYRVALCDSLQSDEVRNAFDLTPFLMLYTCAFTPLI